MSRRMAALTLIGLGMLITILMTLGLMDEIVRTDITDAQKGFGAWTFLLGVSMAPFIAGLHLLVPETLRHPR